MFQLYASKNILTVRKREPVTSGSVNVYEAHFEFSGDWDGLTKTAVFCAGDESRCALLGDSGECAVPWEVLTAPGPTLKVGVYGTKNGEIVLPTVWAILGTILTGVTISEEESQPPTPDLWQQELSKKGDALDYDGVELALKSGKKILSKVVIAGGGESVAYRFGHGLIQNGLDVSVNSVNDFTGDNTLPMTAAGVQTTVGNIEALLATI